MTNGNTAPLYVLGNVGNDYFEVDHNVGLLYLAGDAGDDTFLINTFLELKQNPNDPNEITNLTTLFGGTGSNRYEYVQDAPVVINGGSGYDTIIIDGTPLDDTFIVTDNYIAGAGRLVTFTNIEAIEIEGGGGDDDIWVLSTNPALTVTVDGGSGRRHDPYRRHAAAARLRPAADDVHAACVHGFDARARLRAGDGVLLVLQLRLLPRRLGRRSSSARCRRRRS